MTNVDFLYGLRDRLGGKKSTLDRDITRWRADMNFMLSRREHKIHMFEPKYNVLF